MARMQPQPPTYGNRIRPLRIGQHVSGSGPLEAADADVAMVNVVISN